MSGLNNGAPAPDPASPVSQSSANPPINPSATPPAPAPAQSTPMPPPATDPQAAPVQDPNQEPAQPVELKTSMLTDPPAQDGDQPDPADPANADQGEAFQVEIPEGYVADTEGVSFLEAKVKEGALTKEAAQDLAKVHMEGLRRYEASLIANAQKQVEAWETECRNHAEYGGAKLNASVDNAKLVLQKYATPQMIDVFDKMGVLSHPDFFAMLNKVHADTADGVSIGGAPRTAENDPAKVMFPNLE